MKKQTPESIWAKYRKGTEYLFRYNVYETVKVNEDFYDGKQWGDLTDGTMPTPVFNVLQRSGKFMVATLGSNDIAISMQPYSENPSDTELIEPIKSEIEHIIEQSKIKEKSKIVIRNAFVDGSSYMMYRFNPDFETHQDIKGRVEADIIDCTNMYFGNPYSRDIQTQPYIIVSMRQDLSQVRSEAKQLGLSKERISNIRADNENTQVNDDSDNLVTVLITYWKDEETKTVHMCKSTENEFLIEEVDLEYSMYPIACFGWDIMKNSYLYNSPMTAVIDNQKFINKTFAIAQMYGLQSAFPKIMFDKAKVDIDSFLNSTDAQAVAGIDLAGKFIDFIKIPDFSNNIIQLAQETIAQTKDMMGVTEASLGNVRADNTSAIIQLQESSAVPLEIQKQQFFEMWEDSVRIILDIVSHTYGRRKVITSENVLYEVDFSQLKELNYNLTVEIGNGAQFSEVMQIQTLDKLVQAGFIKPDAYIESIPSKYIPNKTRLMQSYQEIASQGQPQPVGSTPANDTIAL